MIRRFTLLLAFICSMNLLFSQGDAPISEYCEELVSHFANMNANEQAILTIQNVDANTIEVLVESPDEADPIDELLVVGGHGGVVSAITEPETGVYRRTVSWVTPPENVSLNVLWSRMNLGGNSQLGAGDISVPFDAICEEGDDSPAAPMEGAPTPPCDDADVISLFSNEYTDVTVDTWRTGWSNGDFMDVMVDGNDTKLYTNLTFAGIETVGPNLIDATGMTHFNLDFWTPNATQVRVKLVDFGADEAFEGGDDTEHELVFENPAQEE